MQTDPMHTPLSQDERHALLADLNQQAAEMSQRLQDLLAEFGNGDEPMCLESVDRVFVRVTWQQVDKGIAELKEAIHNLLSVRDGYE